MKAKIVIATSALLLGTITTANADLYIESPRGVTQSQWNDSDTYKNFTCPTGYGRGEGVDMNFTTNRADDFYFVTCTPIVIYTPTPTPTTTETSTATTPITTPSTPAVNDVTTVTTDTTTATVETTTATSASTTFETLYAQIMALLTQILALIAKLNG